MSESRIVITAQASQAISEFERLRAQATGSLNHIGEQGGKLGAIVSGAAGAIGAVVAAVTGAGLALAAVVKGTLDASAGMHDLSIQTGASVAALMEFKEIGTTSDTGVDRIAGAMNKLAKGMAVSNEESKGLGQAIQAIGLDFATLKGMKPDQQMLAVAGALDQFENGAGKSAVAMTLFGKEGAKLLPFLRDLADEADRVTKKLTEQEVAAQAAIAAMADDFGDTLTKIGRSSEESKRAISYGMLPALNEASSAFLAVTTQAGGLKETIAKLSADGTITEWTRGGITAVTYLADAFQILGRVVEGVGKVIGASLGLVATNFTGVANAMILFIRGEYSQSLDMIKSTARQSGALVSAAAADIGEMFGETTFGAKIRARIADIKGMGAAAKDAKKNLDFDATGAGAAAIAAMKKEAEAYAALLDKIHGKDLGQDPDFQKNIALLKKGYDAGKQSLEDYVSTVEAYIKQQKSSIDIDKAIAESAAETAKFRAQYAEQLGKSLADGLKEAEANEELARTFGMTKAAIEELAVARMEERVEKLRGIEMADDEIATLEKLIDAKKRSVAALVTLDGLEKQKAVWDSIERTAHDTFISIFDSGKSAFDRLRDTLKNGLLELLYQMTAKKWIMQISGNVSSTGVSGIAEGASAVSNAGSLIGAAGNVYSAVTGGMTMAGGLGTGFMGSVAGGLNGAGIGSGLTSSIGLEIGNGIAGVVGPEIAGALSSGLSTLAAAAPYLAAALAAYALYKHFDSGNTPHTGGASMASAAGSSTIRAEGIGFAETKTSSSAEQMTAALASSVVSILDSTAMAFGKTAGYTAATAFADDSSKDGAWGALVISKLGSKVLDWNDTRSGGSWAPKEFADGDAGQAQYMAALAGSVRTALNDIGLPDWAKKMLDGVSASASMDDLAKVVDQINTTEKALKMMGESLTGFASMSDSAVSALIAASGGIGGLATNASAYYDAFYSQSEKSAGGLKAVSDALSAVGVAMPSTMAAYRAEVEAEMALGEKGAPVVAVLLKNAAAFAQLQPQIEATTDAARSASDILSEHNDLQKQLDQLTLTSAELREKERLSIDASNLSLFDQITQRQNVKATTDALQSMFDTLKSNKDGIHSFTDSLKLGSLSTLTPVQKYLESERQYSESLAKARANPADSAAASAAEAAATTFLTASQLINASSAAFVSDRAQVLGDMSALEAIAGAQMTDAQRQLALAGDTASGIATLNTTALGIQAAIVDLGAPGSSPSASFDAPRYTTAAVAAGSDVLIAEIKRLNARIDDLVKVSEGRRADAAVQANRLETAIDDSAEALAEGVKGGVAAAAWNAANPSRRPAI